MLVMPWFLWMIGKIVNYTKPKILYTSVLYQLWKFMKIYLTDMIN